MKWRIGARSYRAKRAYRYELEYGPNANIYHGCVYSAVARVVGNGNKVSWWGILTTDGVHMLACYAKCSTTSRTWVKS